MTIRKNFSITHKSEYHLGAIVRMTLKSNVLTIAFGDDSLERLSMNVNRSDLLVRSRWFLEDNTSSYFADMLMTKLKGKLEHAKLNGI